MKKNKSVAVVSWRGRGCFVVCFPNGLLLFEALKTADEKRESFR